MKLDFSKMSRKELKDYILSHRDDLEALHALYERRSPDSEAKWFKAPTTPEEMEQQFEEFKQELEKREHKRDRQ